MLRYKGFWKVVRANWTAGLNELKDSFCKHGYLQRVRKYCPSLNTDDLAGAPHRHPGPGGKKRWHTGP